MDPRALAEERLAVLWAGAEEGLWDLDLVTQELRVSPRWLAIVGVPPGPEEVLGLDWWLERVHPHDQQELRRALAAQVGGGASELACEFRMRRGDGAWRQLRCRGRRAAGGTLIGGSLVDVTDAKASEARLLHEFLHDELTGLPNRALFLDALGRALHRGRRHGLRSAVLYLDLDRFHTVNDSLGVAAGDELLVEVARRLERSIGAEDTLARLGGDKFALLIESVAGPEDAVRAAEELERALDEPLHLDGYEVFAQASLGIALSTPQHAKPEDLLRDAIAAMHRAKEDGAVRHELFDPRMSARARERLKLEADVRHAIEEEQFVLHYQPIISFETGELSAFEALVRWKHPERGLLGPDLFVPIAEETGLIVPLGKWVLEEACRQMKRWRDLYPERAKVAVAVNLSARQFDDPNIVAEIQGCLERAGLDPDGLELEMTESVVMARTRENAKKLAALRALGVQLLIDDFGTGYSSLASLTSFPLDTLKIDRSFVSRMEFEEDKAEIVRVLCSLARRLGLQVVAEGIETAEQLRMLKTLDCHFGQGFFFSSAIDGESAGAWIERSPRW